MTRRTELMDILLQPGEKVPVKGRTVTVTDLAAEALPWVRAYLIGVARAGGTVTYGEVREDLELSYMARGMGRLLDLLSADCIRRDEPSLAALVVSGSTHEVGEDFEGDAVAEREALYEHWLSKTMGARA